MTTGRLIRLLVVCSAITWTGLAAALLLWRDDLAVWVMLATCAVAAVAVIAWGWSLTKEAKIP